MLTSGRFSEAMVQDLENVHSALKQVMNKLGLGELPALQSFGNRDSDSSPPRETSRNMSNLEPPSLADQHHGPSCDNSPKATPEDEGLPYVPIHSLYTLTKLSALRSPDSSEAQRGKAIDDFIARGSLSLSDAESLFALYRDRLDSYMYGIGCRYRTLEEVRRKSPILSAAIITVAALHDPKADGVYGVCSSEFRRLMEKSMFERRIDRDYLRAMCVASYWLSDCSWMLSGYAIRRAAECNLHNSYNQAIKEQSQEAADCARLWYILYICDQHLATLYGRPSIVQEDSSIQGWEKFLNSPVATEEDKRLTGQVALVSILRSIRELFGTDKGEQIPRVYLNHISHFRRELDQWFDRWTKELPGLSNQDTEPERLLTFHRTMATDWIVPSKGHDPTLQLCPDSLILTRLPRPLRRRSDPALLPRMCLQRHRRGNSNRRPHHHRPRRRHRPHRHAIVHALHDGVCLHVPHQSRHQVRRRPRRADSSPRPHHQTRKPFPLRTRGQVAPCESDGGRAGEDDGDVDSGPSRTDSAVCAERYCRDGQRGCRYVGTDSWGGETV